MLQSVENLLPYTVSTVSGKQLEATGNTQLLGAVSGIVPSLFVSERNIFVFGVSNGGSGHLSKLQNHYSFISYRDNSVHPKRTSSISSRHLSSESLIFLPTAMKSDSRGYPVPLTEVACSRL